MIAASGRHKFGVNIPGLAKQANSFAGAFDVGKILARLAITAMFSTVALLGSVSTLDKQIGHFGQFMQIGAISADQQEQRVILPVSADERVNWYRRRINNSPARNFKVPTAVLNGRSYGGKLQNFMPPVPMPVNWITGSWRDRLPSLYSRFDGPLANFREKLAALQNGERTEPVVIVHIGDSHIASDSYTKGIRRRLQQRFGDAGRGAVIPSNAFKYASADAVKLSSSGSWRALLSLKSGQGIFGLSGVRTESASPSASMTLVAKQVFDSAQVTVATGPKQGSFDIKVDGQRKRFSAKSPVKGARTFRMEMRGKKLSIHPVGNGRVGVLHWATARNNPGIRYINFGQVGATVNVTRRWNSAALKNDLASLKPDLIVYGFGTNEGFDDNVNPDTYKAYVAQFLQQLRSHAPQADLMLIGAPDGLRRRKGKSCGNGWYVPRKLGDIRQSMQALAREISAEYWDWSAQMGGECGINQWALNGYAARDRVHLTQKGYERSAAAFYQALVGPLDAPMLVATMR